MKATAAARRGFLQQLGGAAGVAWLNAQWPLIAAAAQHAHSLAHADHPAHFEILTPAEATEVTAIAARIIPTDEKPGATEAGVVYFIDRALKTFARDQLLIYRTGLLDINQLTNEMFPGIQLFSSASPEQQDKVLAEISKDQPPPQRGQRNMTGKPSDFFQVILVHTMLGFFADPSAGGNRNYVGWKLIGRDPEPAFSPPFGYYDENYPGWLPAGEPETKEK
jgi:gluconate 2-dehydrogenase gamma chain